ncbi:Hypothetical predicted protein, partial [Pelobates cultripes]
IGTDYSLYFRKSLMHITPWLLPSPHYRKKLQFLEEKVPDHEDHNRPNNVRICRVPEAIKPQDLTKFVQELFK